MLQSTKMPRRQSVARLLPVLSLLVATLLAEPVKTAPVKTSNEAPPLQDRIANVLAAPDLARGFWGIEVISLPSDKTSSQTTGETLYSQNADKLFTPASN